MHPTHCPILELCDYLSPGVNAFHFYYMLLKCDKPFVSDVQCQNSIQGCKHAVNKIRKNCEHMY